MVQDALAALQFMLDKSMQLFLLFMLVIGASILWRIQTKNDHLDLRWLILDSVTKQPSIHKLGQTVALAISSWGFVYQTLHGGLTEWLMTVYCGVWAATNVANALARRDPPAKDEPQQPSGS